MRFKNHQKSLSFDTSALKKPFVALTSKLLFHSKDTFFNSKIHPEKRKEIKTTNAATVALETASILSRDNDLFQQLRKYYGSSSSKSKSSLNTTTTTFTRRKSIKNANSYNGSIDQSKYYNIQSTKNNDTRAAAHQVQPSWTTFGHKRAARQNNRYLLEVATGYQKPASLRTNNTIRQRTDEFVWGRSSPLRSVSMSP